MDLVFIVILMLAGVLLGTYGGATVTGATPAMVVMFAMIGGFFGVVFAYGILASRKANRAGQAKRNPIACETRVDLPKSFRSRLASFLGQDEAGAMSETKPFLSTMPFWVAVDILYGVPPKSAAVIRRSLFAIRRALYW
jgi:hypothetical protein